MRGGGAGGRLSPLAAINPRRVWGPLDCLTALAVGKSQGVLVSE